MATKPSAIAVTAPSGDTGDRQNASALVTASYPTEAERSCKRVR